MASSIVQCVPFSDPDGVSSGSTYQAVLPSVAAGNGIVVFGTVSTQVAATLSCADDLNGTYGTAVEDIDDTTNTQRLTAFFHGGVAAGTTTVTITVSTTRTFKAMFAAEVTGIRTSGALDKHTGQIQSTPGIGTDGVTSGNTATLTAQPALVVVCTMDIGGGGTPAAGTGFTSPTGGTGFGFGGTALARIESKRVTATTAVAGTFTAAVNDSHTTIVLVLLEPPLGPTINTQPQNQTGIVGGTATFTVSATGTGTLHYQWKKNGSNVGSDSSSYTTPTLDMTFDNAVITVDITDDNGTTTSNNAILRVFIVAVLAWFRA